MKNDIFDIKLTRKNLSRLAKRHGKEITESALYKFADGILNTALPCIEGATNLKRRAKDKVHAKMRPSCLFAPNGWFEGCVGAFAERDGAYEFARVAYSHEDDAKTLYIVCTSALDEMLTGLSQRYQAFSFIRYFHYFRFMVEIFYRTIHDNETFRYELAELWSEFVKGELSSISSEMARIEDNGLISTVNKSRAFARPDTDIFSTTERVLSHERFSLIPTLRVAEFSSFAFQYYCCQCSRVIDSGSEKIYDIFKQGSLFRRFITLFNDSLLSCLASGIDVDQILIVRTFIVVSQVMTRVRLYKWDEDVRSAIEYSEMARMGYSKFLSLACRSESTCYIPDAIRCVRHHDQLLDDLAMKIHLFEESNGPAKRAGKAAMKRPTIFEMPERGVFEWIVREMRVMHEDVSTQINTIYQQNIYAKRKLDVIGKDVKFVKAEQDSPSEVDSARRGPMPKHQPMIDAALKLLKKWSLENPAPNTASAAHQVFVDWEKEEKAGKLKPGNRYTNEKAFKGIVARHWARVK